MTCGIYKIENLIDHKCYIGQSVNINSRWRAHKQIVQNSNHECKDYPLYRAIRKYGLENFNFSVLEECSKEELDSKEKYYINYYNSYNNGYNSTLGGQGSHGHGTKINIEQVYEIVELLKNTNKINKEIGDLYNLSETTISAINTGYYWKLDDIEYPIRKHYEQVEIRKESNGVTYYTKLNKMKHCSNCGKEISRLNKSGLCQDCMIKNNRNKNWPDRETLKQKIRVMSFESIAKEYGFKSGNSPKKWCKAYNLPYLKSEIEKISDKDWELI